MDIKEEIIQRIAEFPPQPELEYASLARLDKAGIMDKFTRIFAVSSGAGYEQGLGEMRRHSIASAIISKYLRPFAPPMQEDLFTCALLHDIGKLILNRYVDSHHDRLMQVAREETGDFCEAEKKVLGICHAQVGALILENRQFPTDMVTAVRYHHAPGSCPDLPLAHFVSLCDLIAMMMGFATQLDAMDYKGFPELYTRYKMKEKDIEYIMMNSLDEINNAIPYEETTQKGVRC